jgi:hypothetical protein
VRARRNVNQDTPFPPEVPHALNPPDGALIYYYLGMKPAGEVTLAVLDAAGAVVRHLSSVPVPPVGEAASPPEPNFWLAPPQPLPTAIGINRATWDLRYDAPPAFSHSFEINANPGLTPPSPQGPMARPGTYTVKLTVDGETYSSTVRVTNDPRSPASAAALAAQSDLQMKIYGGMGASWDSYRHAAAVRTALAADTGSSVPGNVAQAAKTLVARIDTVAGNAAPSRGAGFFRRGGGAAAPNLVQINGTLGGELNGQDLADAVPTAATLAGYARAHASSRRSAARSTTTASSRSRRRSCSRSMAARRHGRSRRTTTRSTATSTSASPPSSTSSG